MIPPDCESPGVWVLTLRTTDIAGRWLVPRIV
jgi:hypothetical protein